jgi:hypothetical protein
MKYQYDDPAAPAQEPGEDEIRAYAYHLYQQGNCATGHDVADWLEAQACLKAHIPAHSSRCRLHRYEQELALKGNPASPAK